MEEIYKENFILNIPNFSTYALKSDKPGMIFSTTLDYYHVHKNKVNKILREPNDYDKRLNLQIIYGSTSFSSNRFFI